MVLERIHKPNGRIGRSEMETSHDITDHVNVTNDFLEFLDWLRDEVDMGGPPVDGYPYMLKKLHKWQREFERYLIERDEWRQARER